MLCHLDVHIDARIEPAVKDGAVVVEMCDPPLGIVPKIIVVVAPIRVDVLSHYSRVLAAADEVHAIGVHLLAHGMMERLGLVMRGVGIAECDSEPVAFDEEGGVVHLSLKERWIAPLALVGHKVCRVACPQGVALTGEEGGVEEL